MIDAKKCAAASILESMIKMSAEVQAKGYEMPSWNPEAWKKKLALLKGENAEDDTAGTSGTAQAAAADAEKPNDGDKAQVDKEDGQGVGEKVGDDKVGDEKVGA